MRNSRKDDGRAVGEDDGFGASTLRGIDQAIGLSHCLHEATHRRGLAAHEGDDLVREHIVVEADVKDGWGRHKRVVGLTEPNGSVPEWGPEKQTKRLADESALATFTHRWVAGTARQSVRNGHRRVRQYGGRNVDRFSRWNRFRALAGGPYDPRNDDPDNERRCGNDEVELFHGPAR